MNRSSWKYLLIGVVVAVALSSAAPQADAHGGVAVRRLWLGLRLRRATRLLWLRLWLRLRLAMVLRLRTCVLASAVGHCRCCCGGYRR